MREIKFRAITVDEITGEESFITSDDLGMSQFWYSLYESTNVIESTLGQYTSLKDKNGKEIYEGDIVSFRYYDNSGGNGEVNFKRGAFYVNEAHPFNQLYSHGFEILGNIYENPELLKENA